MPIRDETPGTAIATSGPRSSTSGLLHVFHVKHRLKRVLLSVALGGTALLASACATIGSAGGWPALAATDDGMVVTQVGGGRVAALDPSSGSRLWLFPDELPGGAIDPEDDDIELGATYAAPVVDGNNIYLVSYDGVAVNVAVDDGRISVAWYTDLEEEVVATPVLNGEQLYVATDTGAILVIEAGSGAVQQRLDVSGGRIWGQPALVDQTLYLADLDERATMAVDTTDGAVIWEASATAASPADLVADDGMLMVGSFDSALHAIDAATGDERWRFDADGWIVGPPLVDGETLYAASMRGTVYALDRSGNEIWSHTFEDEEIRATPLLVDGTLVVATRGGIIAGLDPTTGASQWESPMESEINAHGLVIDSRVIYITTDHELLRVDPSTGDVQRFGVAR